jgi:hypothetical protein
MDLTRRLQCAFDVEAMLDSDASAALRCDVIKEQRRNSISGAIPLADSNAGQYALSVDECSVTAVGRATLRIHAAVDLVAGVDRRVSASSSRLEVLRPPLAAQPPLELVQSLQPQQSESEVATAAARERSSVVEVAQSLLSELSSAQQTSELDSGSSREARPRPPMRRMSSLLMLDVHPANEDAQFLALITQRRPVNSSRSALQQYLRTKVLHDRSSAVQLVEGAAEQAVSVAPTPSAENDNAHTRLFVDSRAAECRSSRLTASMPIGPPLGHSEPVSLLAHRVREDIAKRFAVYSEQELQALLFPVSDVGTNRGLLDSSAGAAGVVLPLLYPGNLLCWGALRHALHDVGREFSQRISFYCLMFFTVVVAGELAVLGFSVFRAQAVDTSGNFTMLVVLAGFLLLTFGVSISAQIIQGARVNSATVRQQMRLNTIEALTYELLLSASDSAAAISAALRARLQVLRFVTSSINERLKILDALEPALVMFIPARFALFGALFSLMGSVVAVLINASRSLG